MQFDSEDLTLWYRNCYDERGALDFKNRKASKLTGITADQMETPKKVVAGLANVLWASVQRTEYASQDRNVLHFFVRRKPGAPENYVFLPRQRFIIRQGALEWKVLRWFAIQIHATAENISMIPVFLSEKTPVEIPPPNPAAFKTWDWRTLDQEFYSWPDARALGFFAELDSRAGLGDRQPDLPLSVFVTIADVSSSNPEKRWSKMETVEPFAFVIESPTNDVGAEQAVRTPGGVQ